jgi:transcriptional adapter 2-alpha
MRGQEKGLHLKIHDYFVLDKLVTPIYDPKWTALEELMLIKAIEKFGIDNWIEIAAYIETKTAEQCEIHYYAFYYISQQHKVPQENFVIARRVESGYEIIQERIKDAEESLRRSAEKLKAKQEMDLVESLEAQKVVADTDSTAGNVIGYMPLRGDFNIEYDNDAELILAEMEFAEDDKEADIDLKYKVLKTYNAKLDERVRRKKFVIENNLADPKSILKQELMLSKDEREVYALLRPYKRFCEGNEYRELAEGLLNEVYLKQRIETLKKYREMGLDTIEKIENYLKNKEPTVSKRTIERKSPEPAKVAEQTPQTDVGSNDPVKVIRSAEGYAVLTEEEKEFCEKNLLFPKTYSQCKATLQLKASKSRKPIRKVNAIESLDKGLNKNKAVLLFDFLSSKGMFKTAE